MAVYTEVPDNELEEFVARYDIGRAASCKGIAEGVENSNYLLHNDRGSYILTLYEKRVTAAALPWASSAAGRPPSSASSTACGPAARPRAIASSWARRWPNSIWRGRIS